MKFGCCGNTEEIELIKSSIADFMEFPVVKIMKADAKSLEAPLNNDSPHAYSFFRSESIL